MSPLKSISLDARVDILTSWQAQDCKVDDYDIQRVYQNAWKSISDQTPPETYIHIIGTGSGETPMHNRYITTNNGGIQLGTSLSGLGNKDSDIHILDRDEAAGIENEFINPLILGMRRQHKGNRLVTFSFMLGYN